MLRHKVAVDGRAPSWSYSLQPAQNRRSKPQCYNQFSLRESIPSWITAFKYGKLESFA